MGDRPPGLPACQAPVLFPAGASLPLARCAGWWHCAPRLQRRKLRRSEVTTVGDSARHRTRSPLRSRALCSAPDFSAWGCGEVEGSQGSFCPIWAPTELAAGKVSLDHTPFPRYPYSRQGSGSRSVLKVGGISGSLRTKRRGILGCTHPELETLGSTFSHDHTVMACV